MAATVFAMLAPNAAPNITMQAGRSGNSYTSNNYGIIQNVTPQDAFDLGAGGAINLGALSTQTSGLPFTGARFYTGYSASPANLLTVASTTYAYPIFIPNNSLLQSLQASVITGQTGGKVEIGLYKDNGSGYPGALVSGTDSGDLAGTATAVVGSTTLGGIELAAGWYWAVSQAKATSTMPTVAGATVGYSSLSKDIGFDTAAHALATSVESVGGISLSQTYAALTAAFPAGATPVLNAAVPLLALGF